MKLLATMLLILMTVPCFADETAVNKAVAKRVYEEGLSRGIFTVPYTADFVSRSSMVNATRVRELQPTFSGDFAVVLRDGTKVAGSRRFRAAFDTLTR